MSRIALGAAVFLGVTAFVIYPRPPQAHSRNVACTMTFDLSTSTMSRKSMESSGVVYWGDCATLRVSIVASQTRLHDAVPPADGAITNAHSIGEMLGTFTVADAEQADTPAAPFLSKRRATLAPSSGKDDAALDTGPSEFLLSRGR